MARNNQQKAPPSAELARELLSYDPETGELRWKKVHKYNRRSKVGDIATGRYRNKYLRVCVVHNEYLAHRIIWLMQYGEWPEKQIDHINGIRDDNRLCNLRLATSGENHQNAAKKRTNTSGHQGVSWFKSRGMWRADICVNNKAIYLGSFERIEDAIAARKAAKAKYHTFHPTEREP